MVRRLILASAALAAACGSSEPEPDGRLRAHIAEDVVLTLPSPPAYPEVRTLSQIVRARYGEREAAFEAVLDLSPERAGIVITILGGPRLATLTWTEDGVEEERTLLAPTGVPVENILADIFLVVWPEEAVAASLPEGIELEVGADGGRIVRSETGPIVEVVPDPHNPARTLVRNRAFGYEVAIITQTVE